MIGNNDDKFSKKDSVHNAVYNDELTSCSRESYSPRLQRRSAESDGPRDRRGASDPDNNSYGRRMDHSWAAFMMNGGDRK